MAKGKYQKWLTEEGLAQLSGWARDGLTDEEIAHNIGIAPKTLYRWFDRFSQISQAVTRGKEVSDYIVEGAAFNRAAGMKTTTTIYKMVKVDELKLKAQRNEFMNQFRLDHPELNQKELMQQGAQAMALEIPVWERIPMQETVTEIPPDTNALKFWLMNRNPQKWRDHREVSADVSGELKTSDPLAGLTTEQLLAIMHEGDGDD